MALRFFATTDSPLRAYVLRTAAQMASSASSNGITFVQAKKATCMMVLIRFPMPDSAATRVASMTNSRALFLASSARMCEGSSSNDWIGALRRKVPPWARFFSTSLCCMSDD